MFAAEGDIGLVPADLHLCAIPHRLPFGVAADDHRGFLPTMANGAHFAHLIGQREQRGRAGEKLTTEIDPQPKAHDRHAQIIHCAGQLPDLLDLKKLRLIDKDTGAGALL